MEPTPSRLHLLRGFAARSTLLEGRLATPVKDTAMRLIGIPGEHKHVPCATCHHGWDVNYLVNDIGRHRLRAAGFAAIVFDDGAILVNWRPQCDVPTMARVQVPAQQQAAA